MILYTLKNTSYTMEVYEDKVVLHPRLWKSLTTKRGAAPVVLAYGQLQHVEFHKRLWPAHHQLCFHTAEGAVVFRFRQLVPLFERLKLYFERQIARHSSRAAIKPQKTVPALLSELSPYIGVGGSLSR